MSTQKNSLLIIEDDVRVSRYISHVARRLGLKCVTTSKKSDIEAAYRRSDPDIILLDPKPHGTMGEKALQRLARLHTGASILLADTNPDEISRLEELGRSLDLHMDGVLPGVFDTDTLREELTSVFKLNDVSPA